MDDCQGTVGEIASCTPIAFDSLFSLVTFFAFCISREWLRKHRGDWPSCLCNKKNLKQPLVKQTSGVRNVALEVQTGGYDDKRWKKNQVNEVAVSHKRVMLMFSWKVLILKCTAKLKMLFLPSMR